MMNIIKLALGCLVGLSFVLCGCSHPISISDDAFGVSGGIVPDPTQTQRANSVFFRPAEEVETLNPTVESVIASGEQTIDSSDLPVNFRPLIP